MKSNLLLFSVFLLFLLGCENTKTENDSTPMNTLQNFDFQGHRGARGLAPENTIPSFLKALEYGVTTLELDVVISKDSQIVVSHEPWFNHSICLQPGGKAIAEGEERSFNMYEYTYDEIRSFDCGSIGNPRFPEQKAEKVSKPTLRMVTDAVAEYLAKRNSSPVYFNIETKSQAEGDGIFHPEPAVFVELLYNELKALSILEYTTIQSFDVRTLEALHRLDSTVTTALLVEHTDGGTLEDDLAQLSFQPDIFSCNFGFLNAEIVAKAHDKGIKVIPWTVNEKTDMVRLIEMKVDGLITDYPDRLAAVLAEMKE